MILTVLFCGFAVEDDTIAFCYLWTYAQLDLPYHDVCPVVL